MVKTQMENSSLLRKLPWISNKSQTRTAARWRWEFMTCSVLFVFTLFIFVEAFIFALFRIAREEEVMCLSVKYCVIESLSTLRSSSLSYLWREINALCFPCFALTVKKKLCISVLSSVCCWEFLGIKEFVIFVFVARSKCSLSPSCFVYSSWKMLSILELSIVLYEEFLGIEQLVTFRSVERSECFIFVLFCRVCGKKNVMYFSVSYCVIHSF